MPSHAKKGPPATHIIPEGSVVAPLANLQAVGVVMEQDIEDDADD
jgi:hypothetical protein